MALSETDSIPVPPVTPGVARALSPLVRRIVCDGPSAEEAGVNSYLVGIDEIVVVDPGPIEKDHLDILVGCGGDNIKWIVSTSADPEFAESALTIKEQTGAKLIAPEGVEGADEVLGDGYKIDATEFRLIAMKIGRTGKKFAFVLEQERSIFTGDHVSGSMPKDLVKKIKPFRVKSMAPGHGQFVEDARGLIAS